MEVTPVPPQTVAAPEGKVEIRLSWNAVPGLYYQVQYNSDLALENCFTRGRTIAATNEIMSTTDWLGPDMQRFYRTVLLP